MSLECPVTVRLASERSDRLARSSHGVARKRNGVGVIVDAEQRLASEPSVFTVAAHQLVAFRGTGLAEQVCSGTGTLPNSEQLDVVSGSGTLTLDPLGVSPATGRFQTGELVLEDGTVIAPIDVNATCVGCFPT